MQRRLLSTWRAKLEERALLHAQAKGLLLCMGANLECINRDAKMCRAKQVAGSSRGANAEVVPEAQPCPSSHPAAGYVARANVVAHHPTSAEAARAVAEAHRSTNPRTLLLEPEGDAFFFGAAQLHAQTATT